MHERRAKGIGTREKIIEQTRHKLNADPAYKDFTKKQEEDAAAYLHMLQLYNVDRVHRVEDLLNTIWNQIDMYGNPGDDINVFYDPAVNSITCSMMEKNLVLSIAHHVCDAFKGNHPELEFHNPERNVFYRLAITFRE